MQLRPLHQSRLGVAAAVGTLVMFPPRIYAYLGDIRISSCTRNVYLFTDNDVASVTLGHGSTRANVMQIGVACILPVGRPCHGMHTSDRSKFLTCSDDRM